MRNEILGSPVTVESWSVTYEGDVYDNAYEVEGAWYYQSNSGFEHFPFQDRVQPICKNLTRKRKRAHHAEPRSTSSSRAAYP